MPKDYVRRASDRGKRDYRQTKKRERSFPFLAMLLLLLLVFALIGGIVFVTHQLQTQTTHSVKIKKAAKKKPVFKLAKNTPPSMHYDFYKMLPSMQVEVSPESSGASALKENKRYYVLQFASFTDNKGANGYQNKIQLLGFDAKVIPIARGDSMIYRVQMGPFQNEQIAEQTRDDLQSQGINGILVTVTPRKH